MTTEAPTDTPDLHSGQARQGRTQIRGNVGRLHPHLCHGVFKPFGRYIDAFGQQRQIVLWTGRRDPRVEMSLSDLSQSSVDRTEPRLAASRELQPCKCCCDQCAEEG